jgi:hypothetical protein
MESWCQPRPATLTPERPFDLGDPTQRLVKQPVRVLPAYRVSRVVSLLSTRDAPALTFRRGVEPLPEGQTQFDHVLDLAAGGQAVTLKLARRLFVEVDLAYQDCAHGGHGKRGGSIRRITG